MSEAAAEAFEPEDDNDVEEDPPPAPEPAPEPPKRPRGRPRTVGAAPPARAPGVSPWSDKDVSVMWPEMIAALKATGKSPYDIDVMVIRIEPPPTDTLGVFTGGSVLGGGQVSPAKAIIDYIDQHYHMPTARGAVQYEIRFNKRNEGNQIYGRARLNRPAPEELIAMRRAQQAQPPMPHYLPSEYAGYGVPAFGAPPAYYPPQGAPPAAPAPAAPPPAPPPAATFGAPSADPTIASMQASLAFFSGQLQQTIQQNQQQARALDMIVQHLARAGQPAPAGVAAPPPAGPAPHPSWLAPAPALAAPPPAPMSSIGQIRDLVDQVRALKSLSREVDTLFAAGESDETVGAPPTTVEPTMPFDTIPIPEASLWGRPINAAINKESRSIDWQATAMANPQLVEKGVELATNLLQAFVKASGAKAMDGAAAAAPAAPAGVGALPPGQPNGNGGGEGSGWPGV
ncbi:MAG TPA: hypothetical protein VEZ44_09210 [bacterium]|nr:hypothetical protein [bacterium]